MDSIRDDHIPLTRAAGQKAAAANLHSTRPNIPAPAVCNVFVRRGWYLASQPALAERAFRTALWKINNNRTNQLPLRKTMNTYTISRRFAPPLVAARTRSITHMRNTHYVLLRWASTHPVAIGRNAARKTRKKREQSRRNSRRPHPPHFGRFSPTQLPPPCMQQIPTPKVSSSFLNTGYFRLD